MIVNDENLGLIKRFVATAGLTSCDIGTQMLLVRKECENISEGFDNHDIPMLVNGVAGLLFVVSVIELTSACREAFIATRKIVYLALNKLNKILNDSGFNDSTWGDANEMLHEVCISNMSKFDHNLNDSFDTLRHYGSIGIKTTCEEVNGVYVTRSHEANNKGFLLGVILNSCKNYKSPCFEKIILKIMNK